MYFLYFLYPPSTLIIFIPIEENAEAKKVLLYPPLAQYAAICFSEVDKSSFICSKKSGSFLDTISTPNLLASVELFCLYAVPTIALSLSVNKGILIESIILSSLCSFGLLTSINKLCFFNFSYGLVISIPTSYNRFIITYLQKEKRWSFKDHQFFNYGSIIN